MFTSFNNNLFDKKDEEAISVPQETEVIFVSDMFIEDHLGGAELTSEAIVESSPFRIFKLHSSKVTIDILSENVGKFWIFGNYTHIPMELIPSIVANINYSILEFDFRI